MSHDPPVYFTLEGGRTDPLDEHAALIREQRDEQRWRLAQHIEACIAEATRDLIGRPNTAIMRDRVRWAVTDTIMRSADRGEMEQWGVDSRRDIRTMTVIPALGADGRVGVRIDWRGTVLEGYWQR